MNKNIQFLFLLLTLITTTVFSQTPDWLWAKSMGGTTSDAGNSIAIDFSGNVYTTGSFSGTVDFDPGVGIFNLTLGGGFISKLDASGNFVWAKEIGGGGNSIALDAFGNVYTTGTFGDTTDFDPGSGTFNLISAGSSDVFISKLDSSGNFVWAKSMGGTDNEACWSIATDASGNVYTTGSFFGTADFDPGGGIVNLNALGSNDIFISRLDSSGNFIWAKRIGGTGPDNSWSISFSSQGGGEVYTTGVFTGTVDFNPGAGVFNLSSSIAGADIFISKLDSSGNFAWAKRIGGTSYDVGFSITSDHTASGNVYTTGYFTGTVDFDPGAGIFNLITTVGNADIFISKLDSAGNFIWARALGGTAYDCGLYITLDPSGRGDVYTTGYFAGTADFDPGAGIFNLTSAGSDDIFISKLDSSGNFIWAKTMGGTYIDDGNSIALDASGNMYLAGDFKSPSVLFGSITLTNADNSGNVADIFIAKLDTSTITGIESVKNSNDISIYPNPATNHLTIVLSNIGNKAEVTITDITGKIIYSTTAVETQKLEVITNDFEGGVYLVQIKSAEFLQTKKLIIAN